MPSVYISSTYEDLREYRRAAFEAVRRLRHVPVGMEDLSAVEQRPLETCLRDVRDCQAYVGIIGWKYGSIPPGEFYSFTELEYREAGTAGIPRFVFVSSDSWPSTLRDADTAQIEALRSTVKEAHVVRAFESVEQLKFEVASSLARWTPGHEVPPLLPWFCDRDDQYDDISTSPVTAERANQAAEQPTKPFVLFAHAEQAQALNKFVECVREKAASILQLPEYVALLWREVQWPIERSPEAFRSVLVRRLEKAFGQQTSGTVEDLARKLDARPDAVILHARVYCDEWRREQEDNLRWACQLWQQLPVKARVLPAILFITLEYREATSFLHRWKIERRNKEIRLAVNNLTPEMCGASFRKIRELQDVLRFHAEAWGNGEDVQTLVRVDLTTEIGALFGARPAMPMRPLGRQLLQMLQNHVDREGHS